MKELIEKYVGKEAMVFLGGLRVRVQITDVKMSYGRERFEITPVAGEGKIFVESVNLISQ